MLLFSCSSIFLLWHQTFFNQLRNWTFKWNYYKTFQTFKHCKSDFSWHGLIWLRMFLWVLCKLDLSKSKLKGNTLTPLTGWTRPVHLLTAVIVHTKITPNISCFVETFALPPPGAVYRFSLDYIYLIVSSEMEIGCRWTCWGEFVRAAYRGHQGPRHRHSLRFPAASIRHYQ